MSLTKRVFLSFLLLAGVLVSGVFAQTNRALDVFVRHKNLQHAAIGFELIALESGQTVCRYNENLALCPASTLKTLTTATALQLFGPDFRFPTQLAYVGRIDSRGALKGDLLIVGFGDPGVGSSCFSGRQEAFLDEWFDALQQAGIRSIEGDIVAVDHLYGYEGVSDRWNWGDLGNYYAAGVYGISVFDNSYRLHFRSGAVGTTPVVVSVDPEIPGLSFENFLKAADHSIDSAYIRGIPFDFNRKLYGTIPARRSDFSIRGDIPDPGLLLAQTCRRYLQDRGVKTSGEACSYRNRPEIDLSSRRQVYVYRGVALRELINETNFRSNNHFAEHLFYKIGWDKEQPCLSQHVPTLAAHRIKRYWKDRGVDVGSLFQYDGSGLSTANAVSAHTLAALLAYMQQKSAHAGVFYSSLPRAGVEGSVRSFLKGTPLAGKARVKSGSIAHVQAYAGYIEKGGKRYAFALLVNHFTGSRAALRGQIEKLLSGVI